MGFLHDRLYQVTERLNFLLSFDDIDDILKSEIPELVKEKEEIETELERRWLDQQRG
jgi:hypothetical protein